MPAKMPTDEARDRPTKASSSAPKAPWAVGSIALQAWADVGAEAVRFVWDRLQQDIETQQAMLVCTSLDQIRAIQAEFFRAAQEQYTTEAGKMLDMMGKATTAGLAATAKGRRYDDVPL
jgi:hypothetical protein